MLVNTIEGLTEETAEEFVARAETLAEEQAEDMPAPQGSTFRPRLPPRRRNRPPRNPTNAASPPLPITTTSRRPWMLKTARNCETSPSPRNMPAATTTAAR